jgi:hypothetical protein
VLDFKLGEGGTSLPVADRLAVEGMPFLFLTAYDSAHLPRGGHEDVPVLSKPFEGAAVSAGVAALFGQLTYPG